jgi:hypothetical protein
MVVVRQYNSDHHPIGWPLRSLPSWTALLSIAALSFFIASIRRFYPVAPLSNNPTDKLFQTENEGHLCFAIRTHRRFIVAKRKQGAAEYTCPSPRAAIAAPTMPREHRHGAVAKYSSASLPWDCSSAWQ